MSKQSKKLSERLYAKDDTYLAFYEKGGDAHTAIEAVRERDEARAELKIQHEVYDQLYTEAKMEQRTFDGQLDSVRAERDTALAKLAAVREWAKNTDGHCGGEHYGLLHILDGAAVMAHETQSVSDKLACREQVSDIPRKTDTECEKPSLPKPPRVGASLRSAIRKVKDEP